jgi:hypothetical protein
MREKYILVWQREPTMTWKIYRDIFDWDSAPDGAPTQ